MPDFQNLTVTTQGSANVNVPRFTVECTINDSTTGAVLADYTGANAIQFPGILATLTGPQRRAILDYILSHLILMRGGYE